MLLKKLIKNPSSNIKNLNIRDLALDSRKVKKGDLFFALKGSKLNGSFFIESAINKGAKAVICPKGTNIRNKKKNAIVIKVINPREALTYACSKFFKNKPKNIIAVTGTNGKSSVADFFYQILSKNGLPVASIGTLGIKKRKKIKKTDLTSLDIISIHRELFNLKKSGIDNVIIEASSHGLVQGRLNGINFTTGIFTNFSQDHLDYHKNMKNYFNSKMILFSDLLPKKKNIITDKEINEFSKLKSIAVRRKLNLLTIDEKFIIKLTKMPLIGKFQIKNLLMSVLASKLSGLSVKKITLALKNIKSVNGRLELIRVLANQAKIFVDYAHTPDALFTALQSLKKHYNSKVSLVFGCGGERDKKKRKIMARIARDLCEKIYVTDDNPRRENPKKIRKMITRELIKGNYVEIGNRAKAIKYAIQNSEPSEIILVAGKGHEATQDYGKKIIKISDKSIIKGIKFGKFKFNKEKCNKYFNSKILDKTINKNKEFKGVSINSKEVKKGNIFVAIKGSNKDGHNYISEAIKKGANFCIISKSIKSSYKKKLIKVNNTNSFLKKIAFYKRYFSKAKIVAVTGSSGKTTIKTLLGKLLKIFGSTYYSPKSFNNHYGVPLSLSNLEHEHDYGVFEVGMSKLGEINKLSKLVRPNIGIITNIAQAHIENFKNIKGIAKAKSEIISNIDQDGVVVLNRDDRFFNYLNSVARRKKIKTLSFGRSKKADVCLIQNKTTEKNNILKIRTVNEILILKTNSSSNSNISNILCCVAVLKILNLDLGKIGKFFEKICSLNGRGKMHDVARYKTKFKLIDESYNANPLSVKNALINLSNIKKNNCKKYVLLGDMLELGKKSDFYHKNLSKVINVADIDKLFIYGDQVIKTYKYTSKSKQGNILQNKNDFDDVFSNVIKKNDYLMIKGSNATGLNKLSKNIIKGSINVI